MAKRGRRRRTMRASSVDTHEDTSSPEDSAEDNHVDTDFTLDAKRARMGEEEEIDVENGYIEHGVVDVIEDVVDLTDVMEPLEDDGLSPTQLKDDPTSMLRTEHIDGMRPEFFDPTCDMQDLLLNGSADSMMDMPLFHEVDTLMNIKHEDHFNDAVFYLPTSFNKDPSSQTECLDSVQTIMPNYLVPDIKPTLVLLSNEGHPAAEGQQTTAALSIANLTKSGSISSSSGYKSATTTNTMRSNTIRNSTDILGSNFKVAKGQGRPRALEHMLVTDTTSGLVALSSNKSSGLLDNGCDMDLIRPKIGSKRSRKSSTASDDSRSGYKSNEETAKVNSVIESPVGSPSASDPDSISSGSVVDAEDIDRFVICSDHTMECHLCSFHTESYSAFKSHIICSHPRWRITKKLSKNRLLVERAVRTNASLTNVTLHTRNCVGAKCSSGNCNKQDACAKVGKRCEKPPNPRKRQLFERNKRLFKCILCLRLFVFEGSVVNHVTDHHHEDRPYDFIHISNDHGQHFGPIYRCAQPSCYFSCESEEELERHNLERHTQVIYRCQLCGYTADSAAAVHGHGLRMHQQQLTCFDGTLS